MNKNKHPGSPISAKLIKKYSGPAPRYTSYPTAPVFTESYGEDEYKRHARKSNEVLLPKDLSLYIHIPFCHSLCYFCGCNKIVTRCDNLKVNQYIESLLREIEVRAQLYDPDRHVTQIHFGGGTPNFLNNATLYKILEKISSSFHLTLPSKLEISIEIDPRSISTDGVTELAAIGFNRFSIGVQDFSNEVQRAINRVQSDDDTLNVIEAARKYTESVNVDLISGLPMQTINGFTKTLKKVVDSHVTRIAAYGFAFLPERIKAQRLIDETTLPNAKQRIKLAETARNTLLDAGYLHIGLDHFAKPEDSLAKAYMTNTLQRNFQGYTTHANTDLVGFGSSAISQFNDSFAQNVVELSSYSQMLKNGELPIKKGVSLSEDDILRAELIQQLMCRNKIDLNKQTHEYVGNNQNISLFNYFYEDIKGLTPFIQDQLINISETELVISEKGNYFRRQIAAQFDRYLEYGSNLKMPTKPNVVRFSQAL